MLTRAKTGVVQPKPIFDLHVEGLSPLPKMYRGALKDPNWHAAMIDEYSALLSNNTWDLVDPPRNANIVTGKWIFRHKLKSDGSLDRYKARWVLRGFTQREGIDFDETFSPVVKPATIQIVLSLALSSDWPIHQLDVKNAFLNGKLDETVYARQPSGFIDPNSPEKVCRLNKSLYGLKQAPRAWFQRFASYIASLGFIGAKTDSSLFVYRRGPDMAYLLLYVDDIILTASSSTLLHSLIGSLHSEFIMTDMGDLHYFLGISVKRSKDCLFLSQEKYALELLDRTGMLQCKSISTPVDTASKLAAQSSDPVSDPTEYRSIAGGLQYLTFTQPDISYAV